MNTRKRKHLSPGELRVIRLPEAAVRELVCETVLDRLPEYFELLSGVDMPCHFAWDAGSGDVTIAVRDGRNDMTPDMEKITEAVPYTTESLLSPKRPFYRTVLCSEDGRYTVKRD